MAHAVADPPRTGRGAWMNVGVAALLMVATFPGRSHGLGLFTKPILDDFQLDPVIYGHINLWASLLGAAFCLPCGWLLDRLGTRPVLAGVLVGLGATVLAMSAVYHVAALAAVILLTRGLGQSALSVVSLDVVGRTDFRQREQAMGVFAVLTGVGFAAVVTAIQAAETVPELGWREIWACIGLALLLGVLPVSWTLLTDPDRGDRPAPVAANADDDLSLADALRTPAFWAVGLACALFALVSSGTTLFYEDILNEFGFTRPEYERMLAVSFLFGTAFNLLCGWLARAWSMTRLLGLGSLVLAGTLVGLPFARTMGHLYAYAAAAGFAGGAVTVVFFIIWRPWFGPTHLGKIQGAAQMLTVLASAVSQWLFPAARAWSGSYVPLLQVLAAAAAPWPCGRGWCGRRSALRVPRSGRVPRLTACDSDPFAREAAVP
ncbi:MAG TPA: MFS transporter [Gemmataceae bacterium]|jgi:MFS family permease